MKKLLIFTGIFGITEVVSVIGAAEKNTLPVTLLLVAVGLAMMLVSEYGLRYIKKHTRLVKRRRVTVRETQKVRGECNEIRKRIKASNIPEYC